MNASDARSSARYHVTAKAECRTAAVKLTARVSNLSSGGCCLNMDWQQLTPDQHVTVRIGDLEGLPAQVRWVDGQRAGVAFERSLYGPILDHLVRQYGVVAALTVDS